MISALAMAGAIGRGRRHRWFVVDNSGHWALMGKEFLRLAKTKSVPKYCKTTPSEGLAPSMSARYPDQSPR